MPQPRHEDEPLVPRTFKATAEELAQIKSAADRAGITSSKFIRTAVQQHLERGSK